MVEEVYGEHPARELALGVSSSRYRREPRSGAGRMAGIEAETEAIGPAMLASRSIAARTRYRAQHAYEALKLSPRSLSVRRYAAAGRDHQSDHEYRPHGVKLL
jgi:hypothetical protein